MNTRDKFLNFLGTSSNDLLIAMQDGLKSLKDLPVYNRFQKARKLSGDYIALRSYFSKINPTERLTLQNNQLKCFNNANGIKELAVNMDDCLGRAVMAAGLLQDHSDLKFGEVVDDWFARMLLEQYAEPPVEALHEVLYYELPHMVVVINGKQFDPIESLLPSHVEVNHKYVEQDLIKGLVSACAVNFCNSINSNIYEKIDFLQEVYDLTDKKSPLLARNLGGYMMLVDVAIPDNVKVHYEKINNLDGYLTTAYLYPERRKEMKNKILKRYGSNILMVINTNPSYSIMYNNYIAGGGDD